jgi:hypothetical protein
VDVIASRSADCIEEAVRNCPKCGSPRVHRSHSRNTWERLRKIVTSKRPHRCQACGWRGWGHEISSAARPGTAAKESPARMAPDLDAIDVAIGPGKGPGAGPKADPR